MQHELEVASWFRGFSKEQYEACNSLLFSLRDDIEQGTWYRTRVCLHHLGVLPLPHVKLLRQIMQISLASDLAFLFFLWEGHYKSGCDGQYTNNEQILLSAIAHLDMTSTMRELDRILPPSTHSKRTVLRERQKQMAALKAERLRRSTPKRTSLVASPYFEKQTRPVEHKSAKFKCIPAGAEVCFPEYENYADHLIRIPNEEYRWFANYVLQPCKRLIKNLITEAVDKVVVYSNDSELDKVEEKSLCLPHRKYHEKMLLKEAEMKEKALEQCLKIWDVPGAEARKRRARILSQLERQINNCRAQLQQYSQRQFPQVQTLKGGRSNCEICNKIFSAPPMQHNPNLAILMGLDERPDITTQHDVDEMHNLSRVQTIKGDEKANRFGEAEEFTDVLCVEAKVKKEEMPIEISFLPYPETAKPKEPRKSKGKKGKKGKKEKKGKKGKKGKKDKNKKKDKTPNEVIQDTSRTSILSRGSRGSRRGKKKVLPVKRVVRTNPPIPRPTCTEKEFKYQPIRHPQPSIFFEANSLNNPFHFDYQRIFDIVNNRESGGADENETSTPREIVKKRAIDALNAEYEDSDDVSVEYHTLGKCIQSCNKGNITDYGKNNGYFKKGALDEAIKSCAIRMFQDTTNLYNERGSFGSERTMKAQLQFPCGDMAGISQYFRLEYIDPDDTKLMTEMLRTALKLMANNPKFVLASVPNAYQMPVLNDWIAVRYHKMYNIDEIEKTIKENMRRYNISQQGVKEPQVSVKKYMINKKKTQQDFYNRLNRLTMEKSRAIWLTMRNYTVTHKVIRDPFFAYMPSRTYDITRFKPWKSCDFRDILSARDIVKMRKQL